MQDKERIVKDLATVVGTDGVVVDPDELRVYETDGLTIRQGLTWSFFRALQRKSPGS